MINSSRSAFAITPSATPFARRPQGIYVGGAGDVAVKFCSGCPNVVFTAPPVGSILPIMPYSVETATTATLLVGL